MSRLVPIFFASALLAGLARGALVHRAVDSIEAEAGAGHVIGADAGGSGRYPAAPSYAGAGYVGPAYAGSWGTGYFTPPRRPRWRDRRWGRLVRPLPKPRFRPPSTAPHWQPHFPRTPKSGAPATGSPRTRHPTSGGPSWIPPDQDIPELTHPVTSEADDAINVPAPAAAESAAGIGPNSSQPWAHAKWLSGYPAGLRRNFQVRRMSATPMRQLPFSPPRLAGVQLPAPRAAPVYPRQSVTQAWQAGPRPAGLATFPAWQAGPRSAGLATFQPGQAGPEPVELPAPSVPDVQCARAELVGKELDLIIYGATGHTGGLAVKYLGEAHPEITRWAVAGRSEEGLRGIQSAAGAQPEVITIGVEDGTGLLELAKRTRVILNFAGRPYAQHGAENLIRAALGGCAHYVDISEDQDWNRKIFQKYAGTAVKRGVSVVQAAGFTSVASDLLAMSAIEDAVAAHHAMPKKVRLLWSAERKGRGSDMANPETVVQDPVRKRVDSAVVRRSIAQKYPQATVLVEEDTETAHATSVFLGQALGEADAGSSVPLMYGEAVASRPAQGNQLEMRRRVSMRVQGEPFFEGSSKLAVELALGLGESGTACAPKAFAADVAAHTEGVECVRGYVTPVSALGMEAWKWRLHSINGGRFMEIIHEPDKSLTGGQ